MTLNSLDIISSVTLGDRPSVSSTTVGSNHVKS